LASKIDLKNVKIQAGPVGQDSHNGIKVDDCPGIVLVPFIEGFEFIDKAYGVDGKWYLFRLAPEGVEQQFPVKP